MKIGVIGLGTMGSGMAKSLLRGGHEVIVCNRTFDKTRPLVAAGATAVRRPEDFRGADAVITMLSDDAAEESLAFGAGLVERLPKSTIHVASSTIGPMTAHRLAEAHARCGRPFVSAPVLGRGDMAADGKLFVIASGPEPVVRTCRPAFDSLGRETFYFGERAGTANAVKLGVNFMLAACIEMMGEAFELTSHHGVAASEFKAFFCATMFSAPVFAIYGDIIARQAFRPANTTVPTGLKDLDLVLQAADRAGLRMPIADVVRGRLAEAVALGLTDHDWSVIARKLDLGREGADRTERDADRGATPALQHDSNDQG